MPNGANGGSGGSENSVVEIAVTFHPPSQIIADPDHAMVDWGKDQTARWTLTSEDEGAILRGIRFEEHPQGPPFAALSQTPSNPLVWEGGGTNQVQATYKYDIVVVDGEGNQVVLDPKIGVGNPPG